jgi:uncharacterized membrane protein YeaQ/YmgE (transglycosylase-associated protein family)
MDTLVNLLKGFAPTLATVAMGPAGALVVSSLAKKFGVEDTVASVTQAISGDPEAAQKIREVELEQSRIDNANVANARAMQIAALEQDDVFAKRFVLYLAAFWSIFAVAYISFITFGHIPDKNIRFADTILGFILGTVIATVLNFFFGSSQSSKDKTAAMTKELMK